MPQMAAPIIIAWFWENFISAERERSVEKGTREGPGNWRSDLKVSDRCLGCCGQHDLGSDGFEDEGPTRKI